MIDFRRWLKHAAPGERMVYHTGNLARDRDFTLTADRLQARAVDLLADTIYRACKAGQVLLVQRRVLPGVCEYVAVKSGVYP